MTTSLALQIVACATTLAAMWLMGNKHTSGPLFGIVSDCCFLALNVYAQLWLCVAFCATLTLIHARNYFKWRRDDASGHVADGEQAHVINPHDADGNAVSLSRPDALLETKVPLGMKAHPNSGVPFNPRDSDAYPTDDGTEKSHGASGGVTTLDIDS